MSTTNPLDYTWWLGARSFGLVAFALLTAVTVLGLLSALRVAGPATAAKLRPWHERLALAALACIALHGLLLLGDSWLRPGLLGITVPFTMDYRPLWTGLGILGAYLIAALSLSFYVRRRIGARRWRSAHRLAPIGFLLVVVHAIGAGTDTRSILVLSALVGCAAAVALLVVARLSAPAPTRIRRPAPTGAQPRSTAAERSSARMARRGHEPDAARPTPASLWKDAA